MTLPTAQSAPRRGRTFGAFRLLAPILTALACTSIFIAPDLTTRFVASGQAVAMLAITLYAFTLKGLPVTHRPPVHFSQTAKALVALFCVGTTLWGGALLAAHASALSSLMGALILLLPPITTLCVALYRKTDAWNAWRSRLIASVDV